MPAVELLTEVIKRGTFRVRWVCRFRL